MEQHRTHIDFETRSLADLLAVGEHSYAQHTSTIPLMLAHRLDNGPVDINDFFDDPLYPELCVPKCPQWLLDAIGRGDIFVAHNARFEQAIYYWICHLRWGWPLITRWSCTAARSRYWGLRASLAGAGSDLELVEQKSKDGDRFIPLFCKPREYKGAKKLGIIKTMWLDPRSTVWEEARLDKDKNTMVLPVAEYNKGKEYCKVDVGAESEIDATIPDLPQFEQDIWELDFKINTRGLPIDLPSVHRAIMFTDYFTMLSNRRFEEVTSLRPTQRDRVLEYINQREEIDVLGDLRNKTLRRIVLDELPKDLQDVISIRIETSKVSVKKLQAMIGGTNDDGRARGLFLYYGTKPGRWSGKRIQPQNYTRPDMKILKGMMEYLNGDFWNAGQVGLNGGPPLDEMPQIPAWVYEAGLRFPRPLGALAKSMKGFIAAPEGTKFICGDYAQIQARVLPWVARCMWLLEAFKRGDDTYTRFAAEYMYQCKYEDCIYMKDGKPTVIPAFEKQRQEGKSAVLGCGFQVGGRGFQEYCDNIDLIISLERAKEIVAAYRRAHPEIADYSRGLWARAERAAIMACTEPNHVVELGGTGITFHMHALDSERYWLLCTLPSGRHIAYYRPKVRLGEKWGRPCEILSYRREWAGKTFRDDTYGGKITENFVMGIERDTCALGALNVERAGYPVIGLVHDEIIANPSRDFGSPDHFASLMCVLPAWVTDLPVAADAKEMMRYGK